MTTRTQNLKVGYRRRKCPLCGSFNVRKQGKSPNMLRCYDCYQWSGSEPDYEIWMPENRIEAPLTYEAIFAEISAGRTVLEILNAKGTTSTFLKNTHQQLTYKKILKVLNVQFAVTNIEPIDPDFRKIHVDDTDFWKIFAIINKNENKILTDVKMPI